MKKLLILLMVLSFAVAKMSDAQSTLLRYDNITVTTKSTMYGSILVPAAGASVAVCSQPAVTTSTPCSPRITIYKDAAMTQTQSNPMTSDSKGNFYFYYDSSNGPLTISIYGSSVTTYTLADQNGTLSTTGSYTWDGSQTFNQHVTFNANNFNSSTGVNAITSGGNISYTGTTYTYLVSAVNYTIGGVAYSAPATTVTLATADATYNRFDVIYADNNGTIGVLTGTPAANPVEPTVDATTQINLGFVEVFAGTTTPPSATTDVIYQENAGPPGEWTCAAGTSWNCANTTSPITGTYSISSDGTSATGLLTATSSATVDTSSYNVLSFKLKTATDWHSTYNLWLSFYNGSSQVGTSVALTSGQYGWDGLTASGAESIVIPTSTFSLSGYIDSVKIKWTKGTTQTTGVTIYIDDMQLENNAASSNSTSGGITGITMPGVIYNSAVPVSNSVATPTFVNVPAGYGLYGPVASLGSNVGIRQAIHCTLPNLGTTSTCSFPSSSPPASGDRLLVLLPSGTSESGTFSATDLLGTVFTSHSATGGYISILEGPLTASGMDTVTINTTGSFGYNSTVSIFELTGTSGFASASTCNISISNHSCSPTAFTPSASTDGMIELLQQTGSVTGSWSVANLTVNPSASQFDDWTLSTTFVGKSWIYAPGSTASYAPTFDVATITGVNQGFIGVVVDMLQSSSAGAAPPTFRHATEGDVPASSVNAFQNIVRATVATAVNLPSATDTTVLSQVVTMPSDGCPCRVLISYSADESVGGSGTVGSYVSDGTNDYASMEANTTDATSMPIVSPLDSAGPYVNNQVVTFTWYVNPGTYSTGTYQINPTFAYGTQSAFLLLQVVQSRN